MTVVVFTRLRRFEQCDKLKFEGLRGLCVSGKTDAQGCPVKKSKYSGEKNLVLCKTDTLQERKGIV